MGLAAEVGVIGATLWPRQRIPASVDVTDCKARSDPWTIPYAVVIATG
jgi:hypothetical protein